MAMCLGATTQGSETRGKFLSIGAAFRMTKSVQEWSEEQVAQWLDSLHSAYSQLFLGRDKSNQNNASMEKNCWK
jgi:hypothetical protein